MFLFVCVRIDSEGDRITIFNALDFGIFKELTINKVYVSKTVNNQFQEKATAVKSVQFAEVADEANNLVHHANVICDGCDKDIYGHRYKCLECADFDLCMDCESAKKHSHHLMIRITNPNDVEICHKSKLAKRFLRHRRSESLCKQNDDKANDVSHKRHHHKRYASTAQCSVPTNAPSGHIEMKKFLQSLARSTASSTEASNNFIQSLTRSAATSTAASNQNATTDNAQANNEQPKSNESNNSNAKASATTIPLNSPLQDLPKLLGLNFNAGAKSPCVPLKHSMEILANMANNFAAMMDPFVNVNATAASPNATSNAFTSTPNTTPNSSANDNREKSNENVESMEVDHDEKSSEPQPTDQKEKCDDVIIVDCFDDDEDVRNLVSSMDAFKPNSDDDKQSNEQNQAAERIVPIELEKGSPTRDWTFVSAKDIEESNQSDGKPGPSTGAIPKKTPSSSSSLSNDGPSSKVDYAELSRLLSTHIEAQKADTLNEKEKELSRLLISQVEAQKADTVNEKEKEKENEMASIEKQQETPSMTPKPKKVLG